MEHKSVFVRAIKFAAISSGVIILFALFRMLVSEVVGTTEEVIIRLLISIVGVFASMYVVFVLYLYFNPDADKPRETKGLK